MVVQPRVPDGCDNRPIDGSIFTVETGDGRSFGVGTECKECNPGAGKCENPPAAVEELVDFAQTLDENLKQTPACKFALGPG